SVGSGLILSFVFFFSSRRRHTRFSRDWSSDVCSSDLARAFHRSGEPEEVALGKTARGGDPLEAGPSRGQRARLVDEERVDVPQEIGRASCRERVGISAGGV